MSADNERRTVKEDCVREALIAGAKSSLVALACSGTAVLAAHTFWPAFRRGLGVSGRTALVVSTSEFAQSELNISYVPCFILGSNRAYGNVTVNCRGL